MNSENVKGFRDIENAEKRNAMKRVIEETFKRYNFKPVEMPLIENEEFVRGNNPNDEAVSSVFKLKDRGERKLALRYELTFQYKRLAKNKKLPYKIFQIGTVFRDEPTAGNRWRQFTQCDADIIGADLRDITELLNIATKILGNFKIPFTLYINNRKLLQEIIDDFRISDMNRENVIRELDKLDKFSQEEVKENLKKYNSEKILSLINKPEKYFEKYKNYQDIKELEKLCKIYNIKTVFSPFLARGLSYYNWIIFEIKSDIKETITAGGAYLVEGIQSFGISLGLDRLELLAKISENKQRVLVISLSQDKKSIELAEKIRAKNIPCQIFYGKPGKALEYANAYKIDSVIFIGDEEVKKKQYKIKDMKSGKEKLVSEKNLFTLL
ncbi:ATP phosphoribosyltransferase regulatory subunit [Candidatus Pacearchaeota archaeon]|nr:hypothetical protein [uncultured archaeon]AQS29442.1 hypothetical protein [uncultured archaeon]AQS34070.1 hypothetical protein [uncultured archaeon]MBS3093762.1 ATP phosphoribosyltransferase regulatory subunit [Candidatus Pacearchaeota archaeon]